MAPEPPRRTPPDTDRRLRPPPGTHPLRYAEALRCWYAHRGWPRAVIARASRDREHYPTVVVGGVPGAGDTRAARAFTGARGKLAARWLQGAHWSPHEALFTLAQYWAPPPPGASEALAKHMAAPVLRRLLVLARPERIVCLGAIAREAVCVQGEEHPHPRLCERLGYAPRVHVGHEPAGLHFAPRRRALAEQQAVHWYAPRVC